MCSGLDPLHFKQDVLCMYNKGYGRVSSIPSTIYGHIEEGLLGVKWAGCGVCAVHMIQKCIIKRKVSTLSGGSEISIKRDLGEMTVQTGCKNHKAANYIRQLEFLSRNSSIKAVCASLSSISNNQSMLVWGPSIGCEILVPSGAKRLSICQSRRKGPTRR